MISLVSIKSACWLLAVQLASPPGTEAAATPVADAPAADGAAKAPEGLSLLTFLPMMFAVLLVYFLIMKKPEAKGNVKTKEMLDNLKKNDRIVSAGGILGTVVGVRAESDYITIRIDENTNTKMQILKQSVIRVLKDDEKDV